MPPLVLDLFVQYKKPGQLRKSTQRKEKPTRSEGNPPNARETHPQMIMEFHFRFVKFTSSEEIPLEVFIKPIQTFWNSPMSWQTEHK